MLWVSLNTVSYCLGVYRGLSKSRYILLVASLFLNNSRSYYDIIFLKQAIDVAFDATPILGNVRSKR